jgi:hypothetical protein
MSEVFRFFLGVTGTIVDPVSAIGYVLAGVLARRWWQALAGGAAWAIGMEIFVRIVNEGYAGEVMLQRIVGGLLVAMAVFGIKLIVRRSKPAR